MERKYYPFMDTFRGIAVLWVLFHHYDWFFLTKDHHNMIPFFLERFFALGYLGVDMFFVISGFLITGVLINDFDKKINIKRFYTRRFFKIAPQFGAVVMVGLILSYAFQTFKVGGTVSYYVESNLLSYFLMYQNFVPQVPTIAHTWSLAIEEHFYITYALGAWFAFKFINSAKGRKRAIIDLCLLIMLMAHLFRYYHLFNKAFNIPFQTTFYRMDALAFGCILKLSEPFLMSLRSGAGRWLRLVFFIIGCYGYIYLISSGAEHHLWYTYSISYLAPGCIFISALLGYDESFKNKFLIWIGKSSYGIYLWHYTFAFIIGMLLPDKTSLWIVSCVYFVVVISVGVISTHTLEKYFLNIRTRIAP